MNVLDQKKEMCLSFDTPPCVIPKRFERLTHALEGRCSIQLSYGTILNCGAKVRFFMKTTNFTSKIFIVYTKMIISNRKYKELFS